MKRIAIFFMICIMSLMLISNSAYAQETKSESPSFLDLVKQAQAIVNKNYPNAVLQDVYGNTSSGHLIDGNPDHFAQIDDVEVVFWDGPAQTIILQKADYPTENGDYFGEEEVIPDLSEDLHFSLRSVDSMISLDAAATAKYNYELSENIPDILRYYNDVVLRNIETEANPTLHPAFIFSNDINETSTAISVNAVTKEVEELKLETEADAETEALFQPDLKAKPITPGAYCSYYIYNKGSKTLWGSGHGKWEMRGSLPVCVRNSKQKISNPKTSVRCKAQEGAKLSPRGWLVLGGNTCRRL